MGFQTACLQLVFCLVDIDPAFKQIVLQLCHMLASTLVAAAVSLAQGTNAATSKPHILQSLGRAKLAIKPLETPVASWP